MPPLKSKNYVTMNVSKDDNENTKFLCANYPPRLLSNLRTFRQLSSLCDVEIVADSRSFKAHRVILAACSPYFRAMFDGGLCEQQQDLVRLHEVAGCVFEQLLEFIYSGEIDINQDNVQNLMVCADMLELNEVVIGCTEFLIKELHPSNAVGVYRFAEAHNFKNLTTAALIYIQNHFPQILKEEEIYELPKDMIVEFFSSEQLRIDSEFQVFQAALRWITRDINERRQYVFEVLQHVRLPLMSLALLERTIRDCTDVSLRTALKSLHLDLINKKGWLVPLFVKPRLCARKEIFVIGGSRRELSMVSVRGPDFYYVPAERYDTRKKKWMKTPETLVNRIVPGVATLNGRIYVVGGEQESAVLSCGECYDPEEEKWAGIADMLHPRCEFGLCALDGYLYAMGGWMGDTIGRGIERYDPQLDRWEEVGGLPEPRFSMGVVAYAGLIYMVGGCSETTRFLNDVVSYNPRTQEWRTLAPISTPRSQMGVAVVGEHLYVVGGKYKDTVLNSVERYSFKTDEWTYVQPMKINRSAAAVVALDGLVYAIGGLQPRVTPFFRAQSTLASVECFDPETMRWAECEALPESRAEAGAVVL